MRRQINIPNMLYHITRIEYVNDILNDGLIPNKNKVARFDFEEDEERVGVYLTSDINALINYDGSFKGKEYALLSVDVSNIKNQLITDGAFDGMRDQFSDEDINEGLYDQFCWYVKESINKDLICAIGTIKIKHDGSDSSFEFECL